MINITNLIKSHKFDVFRKFSLKLKQGEICLLKGKSGVGKTTLFRCITDLEAYEGNIKKPSKLAYVFQENRFMPWLNIEENLMLPLRLNKSYKLDDEDYMNELNAEIISLGIRFDVISHLSKKPSEVSGGELQRLSLIQALLTKPKLLLLDEPFNQLDTETYNETLLTLMDLIKESKITTIIVSHQSIRNKSVKAQINKEIVL